MAKLAVFFISLLGFLSPAAQAYMYHRAIIYLPNEVEISDISQAQFTNDQFQWLEQLSEEVKQNSASVYLDSNLADDFPVPDAEYLSYFARGISSIDITKLQQSKQALVYEFVYFPDNYQEALKQAYRISLQAAQQYQGFIWDSETREMFSAEQWQINRNQAWFGDIPDMRRQTIVHAYNNGEFYRAVSLGNSKFALPDIAVNDFPWQLNSEFGYLIQLTMQALAEGAKPNEQGELVFDANKLANRQLRAELDEDFVERDSQVFSVPLAVAELQSGDADNLLLEVLIDQGESNLQEAQIAYLEQYFLLQSNVSYVEHTAELEEASIRAQKELAKLYDKFNQGLPAGDSLSVKAPFVTDSDGTEWMWVRVQSWQGTNIKGILLNQPREISTLVAGTEVNVQQQELFDYFYQFADGSTAGDETSEIIAKYYGY